MANQHRLDDGALAYLRFLDEQVTMTIHNFFLLLPVFSTPKSLFSACIGLYYGSPVTRGMCEFIQVTDFTL